MFELTVPDLYKENILNANTELRQVNQEKDIKVIADDQLKFEQHAGKSQKAK